VEGCLLDPSGKRPCELLFFVFDGRVHYIMLVYFEGDEHRDCFYDRNWRRLDWVMRYHKPPPDLLFLRPRQFDEMVGLAERLAAGIDHVRVDFYDCGDRFYVGELTLYSWSGNHPFHCPEMDAALGRPWTIKHPVWRALLTAFLKRRKIDPGAVLATQDVATRRGPGERARCTCGRVRFVS
jgi:hypothetical protein